MLYFGITSLKNGIKIIKFIDKGAYMADKKPNKTAKKRGAKKKTFPVKTIIKLIETDGAKPYINDIAKVIGVSWMTMKRMVEENPSIQDAMLKRREEIVEIAEESLVDILNNQDHPQHAQIVKWVLAVQSDRYRETTDLNVGGEINITLKGFEDLEI